MDSAPTLPWLEPGDALPPPSQAWGHNSPAPGLLAAGGDLGLPSLLRAYQQATFPWYSEGQHILWWSTDPRMVLRPEQFKLHRSLRQRIRQQCLTGRWQIRIDHDFPQTIAHCATTKRKTQNGTWILGEMQQAYIAMHAAGYAHSVEVWEADRMVGGLYCVAIGHAVFGESMFSTTSDASKVALAALVGLCLAHGVRAIDCQQNTPHLASLGAHPIARSDFLSIVGDACLHQALPWQFDPVYWNALHALPRP